MAAPKPVDRTGTHEEKQAYVEKRLRLFADKILGLEAGLEKLAEIAPDKQEDLDNLASHLDAVVGRIYGTLKRWEES